MNTPVASTDKLVGRGSTPEAPASPNAITSWAALMAIVYLAFCWLAWDRTLIPDEIWALMYAERPWAEQIAGIRADLIHPPVFYVLERLWVGLFGLSDFSAKALPVPINLLAICLFPVLAARVTKSWRLASLLLLTVYLHVFSVPHLVRSYGLVVLLTIVSIWTWDAWRCRPTPARLGVWTMVMSLAVLTHFFCVLLLASFVLLAWWVGPPRKARALMLAAVIPALIFCAWVIYVFPVYASRGLSGNLKWVDPSLVSAVSIVPFHFLTAIPSGSNAVTPDWWDGLPGMKFLVLGAAAVNVLLIALAFLNRRNEPLDWHWLGPLTVLCFGPAILLAGISLLMGPAFHTRFLLGSVPVYWLWVVVVSEQGGTPGKLLLRALILPAVLLAVVLPLRQDLRESPLRDAVARILRDRQPGDVVVIANQIDFQGYWELRRAGLDIPFVVLPAWPVFQRFAAPVEDAPRIWALCRAECNATVSDRLTQHVVVLRHGRYLTLLQREK